MRFLYKKSLTQINDNGKKKAQFRIIEGVNDKLQQINGVSHDGKIFKVTKTVKKIKNEKEHHNKLLRVPPSICPVQKNYSLKSSDIMELLKESKIKLKNKHDVAPDSRKLAGVFRKLPGSIELKIPFQRAMLEHKEKNMDKKKLSMPYGVFRKLPHRENPSDFPHPASPLPGQALQGSTELHDKFSRDSLKKLFNTIKKIKDIQKDKFEHIEKKNLKDSIKENSIKNELLKKESEKKELRKKELRKKESEKKELRKKESEKKELRKKESDKKELRKKESEKKELRKKESEKKELRKKDSIKKDSDKKNIEIKIVKKSNKKNNSQKEEKMIEKAKKIKKQQKKNNL
jgi:hypothetical protein